MPSAVNDKARYLAATPCVNGVMVEPGKTMQFSSASMNQVRWTRPRVRRSPISIEGGAARDKTGELLRRIQANCKRQLEMRSAIFRKIEDRGLCACETKTWRITKAAASVTSDVSRRSAAALDVSKKIG